MAVQIIDGDKALRITRGELEYSPNYRSGSWNKVYKSVTYGEILDIEKAGSDKVIALTRTHEITLEWRNNNVNERGVRTR